MLTEKMVPEFLLADLSANSDVRNKAISDLQRFVLWLYTNPDKPFNNDEAVALQTRLRIARAERLRQEAVEKAQALEKATQKVEACAQAVFGVVFGVQVTGDVTPNGEVAFDATLRDRVTKKSIGKPLDLLHINPLFNYGNPNENLESYLESIRGFDGFSRSFSEERPKSLLRSHEGSCRFTISLSWRPFTDSELRAKIAPLLEKFR